MEFEEYENQFKEELKKHEKAITSLNARKAYQYVLEELKNEIIFLQLNKQIIEKRQEFTKIDAFKKKYQESIENINVYLQLINVLKDVLQDYGKPFKKKRTKSIVILRILLNIVTETSKQDIIISEEEIQKAIIEERTYAVASLQEYILTKISQYEEFAIYKEQFLTVEESPNRH